MSDYQSDEEYCYHSDEECETNTNMNSVIAKHTKGRIFYQINKVLMERLVMEYISNLASIMDVSYDVATLLMIDNRWNYDRVMENIDTIEEYRSYAPIGLNRKNEIKNNFMCGICCEETEDIVSLSCEHAYCRTCYSQYLSINMDDRAKTLTLRCPFPKCKHRILPIFYEEYVNEEHKKYMDYLINNFDECINSVSLCKNPECEMVYISDDFEQYMGGVMNEAHICKNTLNNKFVECIKCKNRKCFQCGEEDHYPIDCEKMRQWLEKERNDGDTVSWIIVNTKKCPNCRFAIEKNQGCRHMKCQKCNHHFCWDCMNKWEEVCGYGKPCKGIMNKNIPQDTDDNIKLKLKNDLNYYQKYYSAYMVQKDSLKYTMKQWVNLKNKKEELIEMHGLLNESGDYLIDAVECVVKGRNIIKHLIIFDYFETDSNKKVLLEDYRIKLISMIEYLTSLIEKPIDELDRNEIMDHYGKSMLSLQSVHEIIDLFENE